jgi:hypothetical protein
MGGSACLGDKNQLVIPLTQKSYITCTCLCVVGRSEFNSYIIIPCYCNNIFALHIDSFTIYALILNTFNFAIHSRISHNNFVLQHPIYSFAFDTHVCAFQPLSFWGQDFWNYKQPLPPVCPKEFRTYKIFQNALKMHKQEFLMIMYMYKQSYIVFGAIFVC